MVVKLSEIERVWKEKHPKSGKLFKEGLESGVIYRSVGSWEIERGVYPPFFARAKGTRFWDVDGNEYIDMYSHMANFLGFAHPEVVKVQQEVLSTGAFGGPDFDAWQAKLAKLVIKMLPGAEMIAYTNAGTESNIEAVRIARTHTKRDNVIKLEGAFHGYECDVLTSNSCGAPPQPTKITPGIPTKTFSHLIVVPEGDIDAMRKAVKKYNPAAVMMQCALGSGGAGLATAQGGTPYGPGPQSVEYFKAVREITEENGTALIYDQVVTYLRHAVGAFEEFIGVNSDLSALGKGINGSIGGAGAVVGKREWMEEANNVVDGKRKKSGEYAITGGTFTTSQLSNAGGYAAARVVYEAGGRLNTHANSLGEKLVKGLNEILERHEFPANAVGCSSMAGVCFVEELSDMYSKDIKRQDMKARNKYKMWMQTYANVFFPTNGLIVSAVGTNEEIEDILAATERYVRLEKT